jgi:hypothetical protein
MGLHIETSSYMVQMTWSSETRWPLVSCMANARSIDGFDGAEGVPLNARNLHETSHGIASHPEIVLHGDFRGMFDLIILFLRAPKPARLRPPASRARGRPGEFAPVTMIPSVPRANTPVRFDRNGCCRLRFGLDESVRSFK